MLRSDRRCANSSQEGKVQVISVKMKNIKLRGLLNHQFQHSDVMSGRILDLFSLQTQGGFSDGHESCRRLRIAAGKERDFMTLSYQFVGQVRNNTLCSAIEFRRNTFKERSHLSNFYPKRPLRIRVPRCNRSCRPSKYK